MTTESSYITDIRELILAKNELGITEVRNLEFVKGLNFNKDKYDSIVELLERGEIELIKNLPDEKQKTFEDLTIIQFYDQNNRQIVVVIYDTDELWQDPVILDFFPK